MTTLTQLARARRLLRLRLLDVANAAGCSQTYIHDIENGYRSPSAFVAEQHAAALGISVEDYREMLPPRRARQRSSVPRVDTTTVRVADQVNARLRAAARDYGQTAQSLAEEAIVAYLDGLESEGGREVAG